MATTLQTFHILTVLLCQILILLLYVKWYEHLYRYSSCNKLGLLCVGSVANP